MEIKLLNNAWDNIKNPIYSIYRNNNGKKEIILKFDTIEECSYSGSANITSYPVEEGYSVVDFKIPEPSKITIKGIISQNGFIGLGGLGYTITGENKRNLINTTISTLDVLRDNLILVSFQTRGGILRENYTLDSYEINETAENYSLLEIEMNFTEVRLLPNAKIKTKNRNNASTVNTGMSQVISM